MDDENGLAEATFPEDVLHRSYSTSSIEDILHQSRRTLSPVKLMESPHKSRSSSYDDLVSLAGPFPPTLTPTKLRFEL
jgi:hypothetical protein